MDKTWLSASAADIGRAIGRREIDPVSLTEGFLEAIAAHPQAGRIYARTTPERALAEAAAAADRAAAGRRLSPLDGVPVSWKDLFDTAGTATEAGSALLAGRVPGADAEVLKSATMAGTVCLGKTHMSELAFSGLGFNPVTETPPCVNDPEAVAGGSSSGAAASVAFGLAAAAVGSDTGGSVRVPAVWNDLVGLKTTSGRLSLDGVVPLAARFDTVGPLCRTVEDATLMLGALEGGRAADLTAASLRGTRLLIPAGELTEDVRAEPRAGFLSAVERLQAAGAVVEWRELASVARAFTLSGTLYAVEAYGTWMEEIEAAPEKMYPMILERFRGGAGISGAEYVRAWQRLDQLRRDWQDEVAGFDAVIMPTAAVLPPKIALLETDHDYYVRENLAALRNTRVANLMGTPALTLPTGLPSTGIMLITPAMSEERLLRLGAAAEAALA